MELGEECIVQQNTKYFEVSASRQRINSSAHTLICNAVYVNS
jgi:hypothetical protein